MKCRPDSKAGRRRAADTLLRKLLRTPKTRAGLIAAVASKGFTRNYVYGWLAERTLDGTVTVLKASGKSASQYQIATHVVVETAREGVFPAWLEPRCLPMAQGRLVFIAGRTTRTKKG